MSSGVVFTQSSMPKKIAIIGPESTGKSTLTRKLATHFKEPFVAEIGRAYLEQHGSAYEYSDLEKICDEMIAQEQRFLAKADRFLFCDTDLIMMKVWYEVKYNKVPHKLKAQLKNNPYDCYLICYPDLPWKPDPLRENPEIREQLLQRYVEEVERTNKPFAVIKGEARLALAVKQIATAFYRLAVDGSNNSG